MADIAQSHPELVKRYNKLVKLCWANSWYVGITSSSRSYEEQASLYQAYKNGTGNNAANPNGVIGVSPWGWVAHGSYHMIQEDGYSHALDLHWSQCSPEQFAELAEKCGLKLTVPGENWHFQWWDTNGIFEEEAATPQQEEIMIIVHDPMLRDGTGQSGATPVYDFTYLPPDTGGQSLFGYAISSALFVRRRGGASTRVVVYVQGAPTSYELPADGTTVRIPISHEGLVSVVGDVIVEAREQWSRV
mgnify:CR=1 FL=1